jgi:Recombination endonuclease VII
MSELNAYLKRNYGITEDEYESLLISQGGVCAICKQTNPAKGDREPERLAVDHNHRSGANRGLLCQRCNKLLGLAEDSQELLFRAQVYLREHDGSEMSYPKFPRPFDLMPGPGLESVHIVNNSGGPNVGGTVP